MKIILKPEWLKSKIGRRFATYITILGIIMALVLSFFISYQQYQNRVSFIKNELNNIVTANKSFIEQSLWILDTHSLELVINGFLLNSNIVFAQITDENGKTIISKGTPNIDKCIKKTVLLYHKYQGNNMLLGKLMVMASKKAAVKEALSSIFITLFQSMLLMFILSIGIIFIFWHLVSKHLLTIQQFTRHIALEAPQSILKLNRPLNKHTRNDELTSVVDAINFMCDNAVKAYEKLKEETSQKIKLEQQLQQAQKMESIGLLAAGVAHDFNNILSVIIGYSELLLVNTSQDNPMHNKIKLIYDSGSKAAILTRQLLAFSRKQILKKKVISMNKIIQDFLKILGKMVGEDIVFKTYLSEENCFVEVDPGQIEQIIMNLIVNARDAMPNGGEIVIETSEIYLDELYSDEHIGVNPGKYVLLTISDTGEGIDKDILPKIFDPFFTTKSRGHGTGLGLSTVYGIVKQHDGYIYVYSEKNRGTTFKIYFPCTNKIEEQLESKDISKTFSQRNETIIIVDDDILICQLITETLKMQGYNCLQATSGKEAVNILREYSGKIHILLTDVVMPDMSGKELAEIIRKEKPEIKVIFMSGYTENVIAHHGVLGQEINFISKPITPVALIQKIKAILNDNLQH